MNGYWSQWGAWGGCSVTCGGGIRSRSRACNDPLPTINEKVKGSNCPSSSIDIEQCTKPRCDANLLPI